MLTAKQLEEIRARAEKATKGPWMEDTHYPGKVYCDDALGSIVADCGPFQFCARRKKEIGANTTFIAHCRGDVPALLAEVERLRERNEKLERVAEAGQLLCNDTGDDAMAVGAIVCGTEEWANLRDALSALDAEVKNNAQNS